MAIERRRDDLERPSVAGLVLMGVGAVVVVLIVVSVIKAILWLVEAAIVVAVVIGVVVVVSRLASPRRR